MDRIHSQLNGLRKGLEKYLFYQENDLNMDFYISTLTEYNPFNSTEEIIYWLKSFNKDKYFNVNILPLKSLDKWYFDNSSGNLLHESGGFFGIKGLEVTTNYGEISHWTQPIIDQPEVGILGIIVKKINGIIYFLLQAKPEPGNINAFQLSPTVQATKSNYERLHKGKPTLYIEYFTKKKNHTIVFDQIQSEQGSRFYKKRNRNVLIMIPEDEEIVLGKNFCWLTLRQISKIMSYDNLINMDSRSVISCLNIAPKSPIKKDPVNKKLLYDFLCGYSFIDNEYLTSGIELIISSHPNSFSLISQNNVLHKICNLKFNTKLKSELIPLNKISNWDINSDKICHFNSGYFSVIGVKIESITREVQKWFQPIIQPSCSGIIGIIVRKFNGVIHLLIQLKLEAGILDLFELSPTIQCASSHFNNDRQSFLQFVYLKKNKILLDVNLSEEGGRFYHESNRNIVVESEEEYVLDESEYHVWMNLYQLKELLKYSNFLNLELRSLISILPSCNFHNEN